MSATRTQIYLTQEQRDRLDQRARIERKSLAQLIREAIDEFLGAKSDDDLDRALAETFGSVPDLHIPPRERWSERDRRLWGDKPPR